MKGGGKNIPGAGEDMCQDTKSWKSWEKNQERKGQREESRTERLSWLKQRARGESQKVELEKWAEVKSCQAL